MYCAVFSLNSILNLIRLESVVVIKSDKFLGDLGREFGVEVRCFGYVPCLSILMCWRNTVCHLYASSRNQLQGQRVTYERPCMDPSVALASAFGIYFLALLYYPLLPNIYLIGRGVYVIHVLCIWLLWLFSCTSHTAYYIPTEWDIGLHFVPPVMSLQSFYWHCEPGTFTTVS
jgi:hypothetical protein